MKSFIMGIYFLGVSLGNLFTSGVNAFIQNDDGTSKLEGASYYWFFAALIGAAAVVFVFYSMFYKGRTYIQGEEANAQGG
jgi:POT family proton-dependent oligopeptide transporter